MAAITFEVVLIFLLLLANKPLLAIELRLRRPFGLVG